MARDGRDLAEIELLADLSEADRAEVARACGWAIYAPGQEIIGHLETSRDVFLIVSGRVRVVVHSAGGRQVTFRELRAGQQFGELSALDERPRSASVVAAAPSELARLPWHAFRDLLATHPAVKDRMLRQLADLVRQLSERVFEFSTIAVHNRVQAELLRLAHAHGVRDNRAVLTDPPTHEQIAARVSTHREAVSRELSLLQRRGVVARRGRSLVVADVQRLMELVHDAVGLPIEEVVRD